MGKKYMIRLSVQILDSETFDLEFAYDEMPKERTSKEFYEYENQDAAHKAAQRFLEAVKLMVHIGLMVN